MFCILLLIFCFPLRACRVGQTTESKVNMIPPEENVRDGGSFFHSNTLFGGSGRTGGIEGGTRARVLT